MGDLGDALSVNRGLSRVRHEEIVNDPELRNFIYEYRSRVSRACEEYVSVEAFAQDLGTRGKRLVAAIEELSLRVRLGMVLSSIWWAHEALLDPAWLKLAETPIRYNKELEQRLRAVRGSLKYLHGVPNHRSQLHADRDRELWLKKENNPSLTWGQLGFKFRMSAGAVERANKRQARREVARLKYLQQTVAGLQRFYAGEGEPAFRSFGVQIGPLPLRGPRTSECESARNRQLDLRFLIRDRADSLILSCGEVQMSEEAFIRRSLHGIGFFEIVNDPELRELVNESRSWVSLACEKYDSIEALRQNLSTRGQRFIGTLEALGLRIRLGVVFLNIRWAYANLLDPEWLKLAKTPERYSKELDRRIRAIRSSMKYLYGVPNHRSQLHADRDRELWLKKEKNPSLTWGQLGLKFGLSDGAAESIYSRQKRREVERLKNLQQTAAGFQSFYAGDEREAFRLLGVSVARFRLKSLTECRALG